MRFCPCLAPAGMGEVYRARDTRLERTVAIKILNPVLGVSPDVRTRFEREARAISQLQHPHICTVYDVGHQDGTDYLVMEFIEGESLAERLKRGAPPLDQVPKIGIEIPEALDKAHRAGIVHRDLKPGNIMLTKSGAKLLDFGLAKPLGALASPASGSGSVPSFTAAPTLTNPTPLVSPLTAQGMIVGTIQYMSPEQIEGKEADARSDIFSFGAVLYEMATGKRAFPGKSQLKVASAILEDDPEGVRTIQPKVPQALERLINTCLAKNPDDRFQSAADLKLQLKWATDAYSEPTRFPVTTVSLWWRLLLWAAAVLAVATILTVWRPWRSAAVPQTLRFATEIAPDISLSVNSPGNYFALSPDGARLTFVGHASGDQNTRIYVRPLDQLQAMPLSGTEGGRDPFFSPDGQWIGFFADGKLKKISVQGGAAVTLCDAINERGGSWSEDGSIVFEAPNNAPLLKVRSAGGQPEPLTTLDRQKEYSHRWPQMLPGGKAVLFTASKDPSFEQSYIAVYSMATHRMKSLVQGASFGRYLRSGHLVYVHDATLFAVPFNLTRLEVSGQPAPVLEGVMSTTTTGVAQISVSDTGTLAYIPGSAMGRNVSVYSMDNNGKFQPLLETPGGYLHPRFSPDGKHLALEVREGGKSDIWVFDLQRQTLTRVTFNGGAAFPAWTPDGKRITYFVQGAGFFWKQADGAGKAKRLTHTKSDCGNPFWRPDGKVLAFNQQGSTTNWDIMTVSVEGDQTFGWKPGEPMPFLSSPFIEVVPVFSPDGHWLAYMTNESGEPEVYVRPYPGPGGRWQISVGGGSLPKWSRNGRELFYKRLDGKIMVADYTAHGDSFNSEKPRLWSQGQLSFNFGLSDDFDLYPDGKHVVLLKAPGSSDQAAPMNTMNFVLNFFEELCRKIPAD
jgi:eukaryotic-like serine/threonine-protein kinase